MPRPVENFHALRPVQSYITRLHIPLLVLLPSLLWEHVSIVTDATTGAELARFVMPDEDAVANIPNLEKLYPVAQPYFFTQDPDYCVVKERVAKNCVDGTEAEGVASIDVAIDSLKVAEYLTPLLQEQLK